MSSSFDSLRLLLGLVVTLGMVSPASAADLKYLPKDSELVLVVQWKQILDSEVVKADKGARKEIRAILNRLASENPVAKRLMEAGFDPARDLDSFAVDCVPGKPVEPRFLIIQGKIDGKKLNACGGVIFELGDGDAKRWHASLVSETTLVAATTREALERALKPVENSKEDGKDAEAKENDKKESKKDGSKNGFKALLGTIDGKQSVSVVATGTALAALMDNTAIPNAETAAAALKALDGVAGAVTLGKDVRAQLTIHARDEDSAKKLTAAGSNALLTLRHLTAQSAKKDGKLIPVADVVKTITIASEGPNIFLRAEASLEVIEKLMKSFPVD